MRLQYEYLRPVQIFVGLLFLLAIVGVPTQATSLSDDEITSAAVPDPTDDIPWSPESYGGVSDIQTAFNNARTQESNQLGITLSTMTLPSQTEWNQKNNGEKALWLINQERVARGLNPLHSIESNITSVAQSYAQYLLDNGEFSHTADGKTPSQRVTGNATIGACYDPNLTQYENLAIFWSSAPSIPLPVERSVYGWLYEDKDQGWGHRSAIFQESYQDNSGTAGQEGFLGIGVASGIWAANSLNSVVVVMNVFDPCSSWSYTDDGSGGGGGTVYIYLPLIMR